MGHFNKQQYERRRENAVSRNLENEEIPEDDEERRKWREDKTSYICEQWYELNRNIERYLAEIDKKYNTHFAPTGALRIY